MKGRRLLPALFVLAAPCLPSTPAFADEAPAPAAAASPLTDTLGAALTALNKGDCNTVNQMLGPVLATPDFAELETAKRGAGYFMFAYCQANLGNSERALEVAEQGAAIAPQFPPLWSLRFGLDLDLKRDAQAVALLEDLLVKAPAASAGLNLEWVAVLNRRLIAAHDDALRLRLLNALTAPGFHPSLGDFMVDGYRKQLAGLLAKQGRMQDAAAKVDGITDTDVLRRISVDPELWAMLPDDYDWDRASERYVTELARGLSQDKISDEDRVRLATYLATEMTGLGQPQHAVDVLMSNAPPRADTDGDANGDKTEAPVLHDENWWWDALGRALTNLGRYDDAVSTFRQGVISGKMDGDEVSQRINLAYVQDRFGHSKDALRTLAEIQSIESQASPYGVMEYRLAHGCAAMHLGDQKKVDSDLAYMQSHKADHPEALDDLLMCMGRMDDAAAEMVRRLDDPERRADALLQLSTYAPPPQTLPPAAIDTALATLRDRADVKAAIARAGGIRTFPILRPSL